MPPGAEGVNVSNLTQLALGREVARRRTDSWLARVMWERVPGVTHAMVADASAAMPTAEPRIEHAGTADVVVDASALLDLMLTLDMGTLVESALAGCTLHAPATVDSSVVTVLHRLEVAGLLKTPAERHIETLAVAPIERHALSGLLRGAWGRRHDVDLSRAVSVELAAVLNAPLIATF
jgi:predicted nucleic acid-binding protein